MTNLRGVDISARLQLLGHMTDFLDGRVTNGVLIDGLNLSRAEKEYLWSNDPGVQAVLNRLALTWDTYSRELHLSEFGGEPFTADELREIEIAKTFLASDTPYEWPDGKRFGWIVVLLSSLDQFIQLVSFKMYPGFVRDWYRKHGDHEYWPFLRRTDYEIAQAQLCDGSPQMNASLSE